MLTRTSCYIVTGFSCLLSGMVAASPLPWCGGQLQRGESAGVRVIQIDVLDSSRRAPLVLAARPALVLGEASRGPHEEWSDIDAIRLARGTIVVADNSTKELRFFDARGGYLSTAGRRGHGPGEFTTIAALVRMPGDSVLVQDWSSSRVAVFGPDGALNRTFVLGGGPRTALAGRFNDGALLGATLDYAADVRPGVFTATRTLHRFSALGDSEQRLGSMIERQFFMLALEGNPGEYGRYLLPFGLTGTVRVFGGKYLLGDGSHFEIREYGRDGRLERVLRVAAARPAITSRNRIAERERIMALYRRGGSEFDYFWNHVEWPERMPSFHRFEVDASGRLWVAAYPSAAPHPRWFVFDEEWRYVGFIDLPIGYELRQIDSDGILAVRRDGNGLEQVVLHEFGGGARLPRRSPISP